MERLPFWKQHLLKCYHLKVLSNTVFALNGSNGAAWGGVKPNTGLSATLQRKHIGLFFSIFLRCIKIYANLRPKQVNCYVGITVVFKMWWGGC